MSKNMVAPINRISNHSKRQRFQHELEGCDQEDNTRNKKNMKTSSSIDFENSQLGNEEPFNNSVTCLNQFGFDEVLIGNHDKAANHFLDAITLLPQIEIQVPEIGKNNIGKTEYDEGIHPDSFHPVLIERSDDVSMKASILTYNIGLTYIRRRDFTTGMRWFDKSLDMLATSQTERNSLPFSIQILLSIGLCNHRLDQYSEAIVCYINALNLIKEIKGDRKDEISELLAYTNNALAVATIHSTNASDDGTNKAFHLFQDSLELYEKLYRKDKLQSIATVYNNIGQAHFRQGQLEQASVAYETSLRIRKHIKNQCHWIDIGFVMRQLGKTYQLLGLTEKSMKQFQDFLDLCGKQKNQDVQHQRDIAIVSTQLACIQMNCGNLTAALHSYKCALHATQSVYGTVSVEAASVINKLGSVCYKLKNFDESLDYLTKGLHIEKLLYGFWHDNVVVTLLNIAQIHRDRSDYTIAFHHYQQVHTIQLKKMGPNALPLSYTLYSMGLMMYRQKSYSSSFHYYQKALYIQRKNIGEDATHEDVAASLNSIGIVLFHWGKHELAKSYFEASLSMRRKLHGLHHPDISVNLFNLATLYLELGDDDNAILIYEETLRVERHLHCQSGSDILQTLHHLGSLYHSRGELDRALEYFNEALDIERSQNGNNHILVGKILNVIGNVHLQLGHIDQMMDCFTEAACIFGLYNDSLVIVGFNLYSLSKLFPECAEAA